MNELSDSGPTQISNEDRRPTWTPTRRVFLGASAAMGASALFSGSRAWGQNLAPSDRLRVAVMGVNSRGHALAASFSARPGCDVAAICDVDAGVLERVTADLGKRQEAAVRATIDFRDELEKSDVDALVISAPDHWHAPATLLALEAGKHVYVEKPCGHNCTGGRTAHRRHSSVNTTCVVQMGNQQRSAARVDPGYRRLSVTVASSGGVYYRQAPGMPIRRGSIGPIGQAEAAVPDWPGL